ncbi:MAG: hypothetical protein IKY44_01265 [Clostridia bacterium]|nr:hypothetical protein [Clostridia bacterium]
MNIEMPQNGRLEFHLSRQELSRMNISFDELDYSNVETRRVIWTLIDTARKNLHADFDLTGRTLVEAFPEGDGGCRLCVTALPPPRRSISIVAQRDLTQHIFEFSLDDFLDFSNQIKKLPVTLKDGELFSNGEKYRLIIPLMDNRHDLRSLISEYGAYKGCDETLVALTREHWMALKRIGS